MYNPEDDVLEEKRWWTMEWDVRENGAIDNNIRYGQIVYVQFYRENKFL